MGKFVLDHYNWQGIFYIQLLFSLLVSFWFWKRQPETLALPDRIPFTRHIFMDGIKELLKYKSTLGFTLISGFITGSFIVYLSGSQQIFDQQYGLAEEFPYIFAGLAISVGAATFMNGTLVLRFGMEKLVTIALLGFFMIPLLYIILFYNAANPNIIVLLTFFATQFFAVGFLFGNLRALAMQPVGHIAGIAAAITGFISTLMAVPISTYIGKFIDTTALPLFVGFLICGLLSIFILLYIKIQRKLAKKMV
jgi:DHA1 family bicyclomycin/chloramphenicol resistance-like MFS transporter